MSDPLPSPSAGPPANPNRGFFRRPSLRRLLIIVVCTYVGVCLFVSLFQTHLIYFPSRPLEQTPADIGLTCDDVMLTTRDHVKISAWYVPCDDASTTVLFFHGNAGNNGDRLPELKVLNSLQLNVMIVDYRGFGKSEGSPSENGTYLDALAAWEYLTQTRGISARSIVIMGESIGGAVAIELARRERPGALIVQSSFTRLADVAALHYPLLPVRWLLRHRYDSVDKVADIHCPKLFFHTTQDSLIPITMGRWLFDAASQPKQFIETPGEHNGGGFLYSDEYAARLKAFIETAVRADSRG